MSLSAVGGGLHAHCCLHTPNMELEDRNFVLTQ